MFLNFIYHYHHNHYRLSNYNNCLYYLKKTSTIDREKSSPFECGFDPNGSVRIPFSLQFFLIAVIFLIFDVEITLLLPLISIINLSNIFSWTQTGSIFLLILRFGPYLEWYYGALEWSS